MPLSIFSKPGTSEAQAAAERPLTEPVVRFLNRIQQPKVQAREEQVIHVSSAISGAAIFYERLRYSIDYREEHLLRRHALERILRRRFELSSSVKEAARPLLVELIHAGYLSNDVIVESTVPKVQGMLDRYAAVFSYIAATPVPNKELLRDWFYGLASAELEDSMLPAPEGEALVDLMGSFALRDKPLESWNLPEELVQTLTFIASYRALFAFDPPTLHYLLLERAWPDWKQLTPADVPLRFNELLTKQRDMQAALAHPAGERLSRALKTRAIVFHALHDVVKKHFAQAERDLMNPEMVRSEVAETCRGYYRAARRRLYKSALRSTFYILLTKVVLALGIEAPVEQALYGEVHPLPLIINLAFPPLLMITIAGVTRFPDDTNSKKVDEYVEAILYGSDRRLFPEVKSRRPSSATDGLSIIYLLMFFVTFGIIAYALLSLGFTIISAGLFLFFLCVVSFFSLRIRQPVRDLFVAKPRDNVFSLVIDFFSLPILKVGRWISLTSSRFNVFLFLFDYFLEAPFKSFLLLFEEVLGFFREKREDII